MYINHLTLTTGHQRHIEQGEVDGETLARVRPWLEALVATPAGLPLPVDELAKYSARASTAEGCLLVTVSGPTGKRGATPLVTIAVAKRSRHGAALWPMLVDTPPGIRKGVERPAEPWCAVRLYPAGLVAHPSAVAWLGDLERCVAWAWVTRSSDNEESAT